jgi:hypothetical protein
MNFGWNESVTKVHPRCDPSGTKVKHKWNVSETPVELGGARSVINICLLG